MGSSGARECQRVLVFAQVRRSTWGCTSAERSMVRKRSTVRFRKGAPRVRSIFRFYVRRPLLGL
jgi:hypothetical protein